MSLCQSAYKFDPVSAPKFDPLARRCLTVALVSSELAGIAETSAGGVIVVAAFEPPAVVTGLDDVAVMGQPVEQRGGHLGVAEHAGPFSEGEIGGDDDGSALIEPANQMEEKLATRLSKGQISEFVQHDEVHPGQMFGKPALTSVTGLALKAIDQVDHVVEATAGAGSDSASGDCDGQVGFARAGAANEHDVALLGDEAAAGEIIDERPNDRGCSATIRPS